MASAFAIAPLEDSLPVDRRYSSCVDLLQSRFVAADYADLDITGFRVTRVTRIHNRLLRNRFEERLEAIVNVNDVSYKRSLEYLFFGENESMSGELVRAMEEGVRALPARAAPSSLWRCSLVLTYSRHPPPPLTTPCCSRWSGWPTCSFVVQVSGRPSII